MKKLSHDDHDQALIAFLREHAPLVPPAGAALEERVMAATQSVVPLAKHRRRLAAPRPWLLAFATSGLVAAAVASFLIYQKRTAAVAEDNEAFADSNWQALMVGSDQATDGDQVAAALVEFD